MTNTEMIETFKKYVKRDGLKVTIGLTNEEALVSREFSTETLAKAFVADAWWFLEVVVRDVMRTSD